MAETTADVRRDIELTRERMTATLDQLERKMNVAQVVRDHPWPALAVAIGAGFLLSGSRADVRAAAATVTATRGASSKIGTVLDDLVAGVMTGVTQALEQKVVSMVDELKDAIGAPTTSGTRETRPRRGEDGEGAGGGGSTPRHGMLGESSSGMVASAAFQGEPSNSPGGQDWQSVRAD